MPVEQAGPPYSGPVPYPPVDITRISLGIEGDFLYMRVDFAGVIPTERFKVQASGEIGFTYNFDPIRF